MAEFALRQTMTEATEHRSSAPPYVFARVEFDLPPRGALDTFSLDRATQLFERFARNGTWQVPTLVEDAAFALSVTNRVLDQPGMKFVPSLMRKSWNLSKLLENLEAEDRNDLVRIGSKRLQLVEAMHRAGVNILPGTGRTVARCTRGSACTTNYFYWFRRAADPTDALRAATWDAAKFLGPARVHLAVSRLANSLIWSCSMPIRWKISGTLKRSAEYSCKAGGSIGALWMVYCERLKHSQKHVDRDPRSLASNCCQDNHPYPVPIGPETYLLRNIIDPGCITPIALK